jgi:hypothetical protein
MSSSAARWPRLPVTQANAFCVPAGRQRIESCDQLLDRVIPRDGGILAAAAIAAALERLRDAIGVVGDLDRRLTASAERTAVDGIHRAAFELLGGENLDDARLSAAHDVGLGVHHAHRQAAA